MSNGVGHENGLLMRILGGVIALGIILILGSYGYTRSEMQVEQDEKKEWRKEHSKDLDKRFREIQQSQEKLSEVVNRSNNVTQDMLQQILNEQKKVSESLKKEKR